VEDDTGVVVLIHAEHPVRFGQEDGVSVFVVADLVALQPDEFVEFGLVVGGNPAGAACVHGHPPALGPILG
jgi:hypothetical protein